MRFKFVHAADLHLDSPFRGLSAHGPLQAKLQEATFEALERIVRLAIEEKVLFVALAGDLFDERDRSVRARLRLRDAVLKLHDAGIQTFIVHGNHDPLSGDSQALSFPSSVKVFGEAWEEVVVRRGEEVVCRVQGCSYPRERVTEDLSRHYRRQGPEFTVGVLHCNLGGDGAHANYAPCTVEDLSRRELDYWALGHVHTRAEYRLSSGGIAVYPGNPQGRHVNETGPRGCVLVEVDGRQCKTRFVPVDVARWHKLDVDVEGVLTLDGLEVKVEEVLDGACEDGHLAHAVRLQLGGRGPMHRELSSPLALEQMEERLRETLAKRSPPVLLEMLVDRTRPELDMAEVLAAGGLPAAVFKEVKDAKDNAAIREALLSDSDFRKLDGALKKVGLPAATLAAGLSMERAAYRALELLMGDEEAEG